MACIKKSSPKGKQSPVCEDIKKRLRTFYRVCTENNETRLITELKKSILFALSNDIEMQRNGMVQGNLVDTLLGTIDTELDLVESYLYGKLNRERYEALDFREMTSAIERGLAIC